MVRCDYASKPYSSIWCIIVDIYLKNDDFAQSISSQLVLVFMSFGGPYLAEFESYGDSESTFTCLTFHFESIDILGFSERHREVAQIDFLALKKTRVLSQSGFCHTIVLRRSLRV